jgi:hypothetical protein
METSDVRSIDSLRLLRGAVLELAHNWDLALQQIRFSMHRIEGHFASDMPNHWKHETRLAEQRLAEALDNLSRQQGNATDGNAPALTEAKQRVQLARRRLVLCEEKLRAAKKISIQIEQMCKDLSGPLAEVTAHVDLNLPGGAEKLARLIGHLDRYAEQANFAFAVSHSSATPSSALSELLLDAPRTEEVVQPKPEDSETPIAAPGAAS